MTKISRLFFIGVISLSILLSGCTNSQKIVKGSPSEEVKPTKQIQSEQTKADPAPTQESKAQVPSEPVDLAKVKPNESGKIMVVMFHNFVESFTPTKGDKGEYTTTFDEFRKLLPSLYEKGFRLVSVNDYINNNITVPAGYIPMMFTFDDGTAGQFNLVEENGKLVANKQSAVGIMEEFNKTHPDFGLKGTFYVNLGLKTFEGKGTVSERLKYLIDSGFEIGNHTYSHINLSQAKSAEVVQKEIGGNQKKMYELVPEYKMTSLALPFGIPSKELQAFVAKGEYQGVKYENLAIMNVGWDPTVSQQNKNYNPLSTHRIRSSGITPVDADLAWWLAKTSRNELYVSDGDPKTIAVPKAKETDIDKTKLKDKKLIVY